MNYTVDKALGVAKQTVARLRAFQPLSSNIDDTQGQRQFIAAFEIATRLYEDFQIVNRSTLTDESSEIWPEYCDRIFEVDEIFCQLKAIYLGIQQEMQGQTQQLAISRCNSARSVASDASLLQNSSNHRVKLPQIVLKSFDGVDIKDFVPFIQLYNSLIHQNVNLSLIEKYQYLISSLAKEPLALVKHLPLTSENYLIAYQALVDRYQNDRVLATMYWQAMCNAPTCNNDSAQSLRNLLNTFNENLTALSQFKDVNLWDFTLFNLLIQKVDPSTRKQFEIQHAPLEFPTLGELKQFLTERCCALETTSLTTAITPANPGYSHNKQFIKSTNFKGNSSNRPQVLLASTNGESPHKQCVHCKSNTHQIYRCETFLKLIPQQRFDAVKAAHLCINCLSSTHSASSCKSTSSCRNCSGKHNSLLHFNQNTTPSAPPAQRATEASVSQPAHIAMSSTGGIDNPHSTRTVLLATVVIKVEDKWKNFQTVRAICDSASQSSFVTDRCRKRLGLSLQQSSSPIKGIGQTAVALSHGSTQCKIRTVDTSDFSLEFPAMVLPNICSDLPSVPLSPHQSFSNLKLADPQWNIPGSIEMLLGADVYACIVRGGFIPGDGTCPAAINTVFGWALLGTSSASAPVHSFFVSCEPCLDDTLKSFWNLEEIPYSSKALVSSEDQQADKLFTHSHFREPSGRFGIHLPFKDDKKLPTFQGSLDIADRRFLALERRLISQPLIRKLYNDFMYDYLESGHMSKLSETPSHANCYFIPHHCVFKANGDTNSIRVVFDASAKARNEVSLNDCIISGPKLQADIAAILFNFRTYVFAFTCDVRQMFRQILVWEPHRSYQLIRWRFTPEEPVGTYSLNTVTYGVSSSPFIAIRCLLQLADEHKDQFHLASQALLTNLYVDDLACGANDITTALELRKQLVNLLQLGCFELRKWSANHHAILENIPTDHVQSDPSSFDSDAVVKILGLQWHANTDMFSFKVTVVDAPCTKRSILSEVARIYDPLGFLAPLTFFAKHLIQHLWTLWLDWDAVPPHEVSTQWNHYKNSISLLSQVNIPRCLRPNSFTSCQLHAFCDASQIGYAAVVYFRFTDHEDHVCTFLVVAKSKVAPLKRISIPRLELCAAVLLSDLVGFVLQVSNNTFRIDNVFAWSDSTVALSWIRSPPHKWKTFVANRVTHIQEIISPNNWYHVRSGDNPADPASRGLLPQELLTCSLWWAGPPWLSQPSHLWPTASFQVSTTSDLTGEEQILTLVTEVIPSISDILLQRFSSLRKIQRIAAYCCRFINRLQKTSKFSGPLVQAELHQALLWMVKDIQSCVFKIEIKQIQQGLPCSKQFLKLTPFLDKDGILRVGGRLTQSSLPFETTHPALLPNKNRLSELLIIQTHRDNLHSGINTTVYLLEQNFWILSARRAVRLI